MKRKKKWKNRDRPNPPSPLQPAHARPASPSFPRPAHAACPLPRLGCHQPSPAASLPLLFLGPACPSRPSSVPGRLSPPFSHRQAGPSRRPSSPSRHLLPADGNAAASSTASRVVYAGSLHLAAAMMDKIAHATAPCIPPLAFLILHAVTTAPPLPPWTPGVQLISSWSNLAMASALPHAYKRAPMGSP